MPRAKKSAAAAFAQHFDNLISMRAPVSPEDQDGYSRCNYARYLAKDNDRVQFDGIYAWIAAGRPAE